MRIALIAAVGLVLAAGDARAQEAGHKLISARQVKSSRSLCEKTWPKKKKPPKAMTDRCLQYWLFAHNYERPKTLAGVENALSMDPTPAGGAKYTAAMFRQMAAHVRAAFPKDSGWLVERSLEFFMTSAGTYTSFFDMNLDVEGALKKIMRGKAFNDTLEGAGTTTLWLLRNASYARHGRKFKHPDLNHYFYGKWKRPASVRAVLPARVNPKFKDSMLSRTDRANVRRIRAEEKRRK